MDAYCSLEIFEMEVGTSEPSKENVKRDLLIFMHYQMYVKEIICPLRWWEKHGVLFPIVGFLTQQILGIVGSQIETKRIFSLSRIFINLRRCL